jgi:hypothetical protein
MRHQREREKRGETGEEEETAAAVDKNKKKIWMAQKNK